MQLNPITLSRRLYRALNAWHLRWALRVTDKQLTIVEREMDQATELVIAMARAHVQPIWLTQHRFELRSSHAALTLRRLQIRQQLAALGVAA